MTFISIFNDVMGPVMRGPSSSHTAGGYHLGRLLHTLAGGRPDDVLVEVDPRGSMAATFESLSVDRGMVTGLMGWEITDERFVKAVREAGQQGMQFRWEIKPLSSDHPNAMAIHIRRDRREFQVEAAALGGGSVLLSRFQDWEVECTGKQGFLWLQCTPVLMKELLHRLEFDPRKTEIQRRGQHAFCALPLTSRVREIIFGLSRRDGVEGTWLAEPLFFPRQGDPLFLSAEDLMKDRSERRLGQWGVEYESRLLGLGSTVVKRIMEARLRVMESAVDQGLRQGPRKLKLLKPSASGLFRAEQEGSLPFGGLHTRAAARALAVMHVSNSLGTICAAPTGGSAGVIPGVLLTLAEEKALKREELIKALFAASVIGLLIARRATFAAEEAGCQVEIGAAGAMAAAAVVDASGGTVRQALNAAAVSLQNTMGSVCDPVQGRCEIPCHTRNAVAASGAFVCADLIMGGYENPIPLDETIDAMMSVGRLMHPDLRCTARGGIAGTATAQKMGNPD